jgi:hypothetical protein
MTAEKKKNSQKGKKGRGAKGKSKSPLAERMNKLRAAFYDAVTDEDIEAIVEKQIEMARCGDKHASQFIFDRIFGKPISQKGSGTEDDPIHYVVRYFNADDNGK